MQSDTFEELEDIIQGLNDLYKRKGEYENIISQILKICKTGKKGDGKIFVYPVERIIRISTREEGGAAL